MTKLDRPLYTKLLKHNKVTRKDINKKVNINEKSIIIKDLAQRYDSRGANPKEIKALIRQHGLRLPKVANRDILNFSGIHKLKTRAEQQKEIYYIKLLKGTTIPSDDKIFKTKGIVKGTYSYIIEIKGINKKIGKRTSKTYLLGFDKPVSKNFVKHVFQELLDGEDVSIYDVIFIDSPPLESLEKEIEITSWRIVGVMKGV